jgi:hypothetical protein
MKYLVLNCDNLNTVFTGLPTLAFQDMNLHNFWDQELLSCVEIILSLVIYTNPQKHTAIW